MSDWKLQDAKNRFSELVETALVRGPQRVTRRGKPAVVVVAAEEFDAMQRATPPRKDFVSFLLDGPRDDLLSQEVDRHRKDDLKLTDPFEA